METIFSSGEDLLNLSSPCHDFPTQIKLPPGSLKKEEEIRLQEELISLLQSAPKHFDPMEFLKDSAGFQKLFARFLDQAGQSVEWRKVEELPSKFLWDYDCLSGWDVDSQVTAAIPKMLGKLVIVKLNGGLGTSMGCKGPKSAIPVRDDLTFLDLTLQQIENLNESYNVSVPLVLMNSFNTYEETEDIIRKYSGVKVHTFVQSCYPRIDKETLLPIAMDLDVLRHPEGWYPPGHGNFYETFKGSGLLKQFIDEGREYCFVSNIDNLGGTFDYKIFNLIQSFPRESRPEFMMEVTSKTRADVKGGALIYYKNKPRLLEIAQVPEDHVDDFKAFKYFNTNNLWIKLDAIERVVSEDSLDMEVIVNPKKIDGGYSVIQLETAIGAAMKSFERGLGIRVPRSRFIPVKKTSDLLLLMSNLYELHRGYMAMSTKRTSPTTPFITLEKHYFGKVKEFRKRFSSIPDIAELDHLTVSGDVSFGKDVRLKGTVIIVCDHKGRIDIPDGAVLENKTVTGALVISNH